MAVIVLPPPTSALPLSHASLTSPNLSRANIVRITPSHRDAHISTPSASYRKCRSDVAKERTMVRVAAAGGVLFSPLALSATECLDLFSNEHVNPFVYL